MYMLIPPVDNGALQPCGSDVPPQQSDQQTNGFWDFVSKAAMVLGLAVSVRTLMR
jgi:hypothetical protein